MLTDNQYLAGLLQNDKAVIEAIFRDFFPGARHLIVADGGTNEDAEDIFIYGLESVFRNAQAPGFQLQFKLKTYLFEICKRRWWREKARKNRHKRVTELLAEVQNLDFEPTPDAQMDKTERFRLIAEKLELLNPQCREIMRLTFQEGKSNEEIEQLLGFSSGNFFRKTKSECKAKLIELIKKDPRWQELSSPEKDDPTE